MRKKLHEVKCPQDGAPILYSGNYYCSGYDAGHCRWALPHPQDTYEDRMISWWLCGYWEGPDQDYTTEPVKEVANGADPENQGDAGASRP